MNNPIHITASDYLAEPSRPSQLTATKKLALQKIRQGGTIIFPTETIYGLGAIATNADAATALFRIKGRSLQKPPPVIAANQAQLLKLVSFIPPHAKTLMKRHWPGALTIIFPANPSLPKIICGKSTFEGQEQLTIAVRMTSHALAKRLCEDLDAPLIATSANFSGATGRAATPQVLTDVEGGLTQEVDVVVDGKAEAGIGSTIVDCTVFPARVLRKGAIELFAKDLTD